jgi:hypothetical protein
MEEVIPLTLKQRAQVAKFAVRIQSGPIMPHADKINLCCEVVAQARSGTRPKDICAYYKASTPGLIYKIISRGRKAGVIPPFKPVLQRKARSQVTQLKLGSMYALAQICGDDLLYWIVRNKPEGSTAAEFMAAILRDAMFEDEDEANAEA